MITAYYKPHRQLTQVEHSFMLKPASDWAINPIINDYATLIKTPSEQWYYDETTTELRVLTPQELDTLPDRVANAKIQKLSELTSGCSKAITSGFSSMAQGTLHWYDATEVDQINLISSIASAAPTPVNPDGLTQFYPCRDDASGLKEFHSHTYKQLLQVAADGGKSRILYLQRLAYKKIELEQAQTVTQINNITWN